MQEPNPYEAPQGVDSATTSRNKWARWEKTRMRGRRRFIWWNGVLGWGVSVGIFWSIWMAAVQGWEQLPLFFGVAMVVFPIGGYFFGVTTWAWTERLYLRAQSKAPLSNGAEAAR